MSAAMDDFGISGVSNALPSGYNVEQVKPGTSEKESTEQISGSEQTQPEIDDVFIKKSTDEKRALDKLQDDYATLQERGQLLEEMDAVLAQAGEADISDNDVDEINSILDEIVPQDSQPEATDTASGEAAAAAKEAMAVEKAPVAEEEQKVREQEADEQKAVDEEEKAKKEEQTADSAQEREKASREVSELRAKASEKQQEIAKLQKELYHKVSSIVELSISRDKNTQKTVEEQVEELKTSVSQEIKENPVKSVKMQITNLDENLILAMLSLRR